MTQITSLGSTFKIFDAAKNISGAGLRFSNASAETIASNLAIKAGLILPSETIKIDEGNK